MLFFFFVVSVLTCGLNLNLNIVSLADKKKRWIVVVFVKTNCQIRFFYAALALGQFWRDNKVHVEVSDCRIDVVFFFYLFNIECNQNFRS